MIKILSFISVLVIITGNVLMAQETKEPPTTLTKDANGFTFEKVIEIPNVSKVELYNRVKLWVTGNLKTVDNNISFDDQKKENISTSTAMPLKKNKWQYEADPYINFKITFAFKDGKLKVNASDFIYHYYTYFAPFDKLSKAVGVEKKFQPDTYEDFDIKFSALITSLQKAAEKNGNW